MITKESYMPNSCPYCGDSGVYYIYSDDVSAQDVFYKPYVLQVECGKCHKKFKRQYRMFYDKTIYEVENEINS